MTPKQKQKCKLIIEHYGANNQRRQLVEECSELITAIVKLERAIDARDPALLYVATGAVREELADVEIMLEQMKNTQLAGTKRGYTAVIDFKLNRQLDRMKEGD